MKILINGASQNMVILLRAILDAKDHEITHCSDGVRTIEKLLQNGYDWAIIDGRALSRGVKDFVRITHLLGSTNGRTSENPRATVVAEATSDPACSVRWSGGGILELRCALHTELSKAVQKRKDPTCALKDREYNIFEYHAPCKKFGGRGV